ASWISFNCVRPGVWVPGETEIADLESAMVLPFGLEVGGYACHYAGVTENGRRMIRGVLVGGVFHDPAEKPGIYVGATEAELPAVADGGCDGIYLSYDPLARKMNSLECNGGR